MRWVERREVRQVCLFCKQPFRNGLKMHRDSMDLEWAPLGICQDQGALHLYSLNRVLSSAYSWVPPRILSQVPGQMNKPAWFRQIENEPHARRRRKGKQQE